MGANLSFQAEKLVDVRHEALPLLDRHWEEIALNRATVPLDPDWDLYAKIEAAGVFHLVTARDAGKLVGYAAYLISGNLHYRSLRVAESDLFYLAPEYRRGTAGMKLLRAVEAHLVTLGVNRIVNRIKLHHDIGPVFERLGFKAIERVYAKMVGG